MKLGGKSSPAKGVAGEHFRKSVGLLAQAEFLDRGLVAIGRRAFEVLEQFAAAGDEEEQPAAGRVVFDVRLEMLGELVDALSQQRNLHVGAAGVFLVQLERLDVLGVCHIKFFISLSRAAKYGEEFGVGKWNLPILLCGACRRGS